MDVDLLRPGNVPISPNTVLWFEFLLNPDLLEEHLKKSNPDPVPIDLLIKFLTLSVEPSVEDASEKIKTFKCSKRHLAMKILALKIVAYWKWDLEIIESKLPLQLQYVLLRDILCLTCVDSDQNLFNPTMHHNINFEELRDEQLFAISLYHRWALRIIVHSPMVSKIILCSTTTNVESADEIMSKVMDDEGNSEIVLQKIIALKRDFIICPTFFNFFPPTEDCDLKQDWQNGLSISIEKFYCQIYNDLGTYKLYRELNIEASEYFVLSKDLFDKLKISNNNEKSQGFFEVKEENLCGFSYACGVMEEDKQDLTLQFYSAIRNNFTNIINVLQADNIKKEIPLSYRDSLELDLASTLASGKFTASRDLLFQIQTLNSARRMLEGASYPSVLDYAYKLNASRKGNDILLKILKPLMKVANTEEKNKITLFLLTLFEKCDITLARSILSDKDFKGLFSESELKEVLGKFDESSKSPNLCDVEERHQKKIKLIGNTQLELCMLERQIIATYDPLKLKELLIKFSSLNNARSITNIYNKWEVSNNMCKIITNLPNQFLQQYCYTALAKVKELIHLQNYTAALELIRVADEELKKHGNSNALYKFSQMLFWETLYINMIELQFLWPAKNINRPTLLMSCKGCMQNMQQSNDPKCLQRLQLMEQCVITLLNLAEWEYLSNSNFQKRFRYLEISVAISSACLDVVKFKGNKKFSKEPWDLIVPAFLTSNLQRRSMNQFSDRDNTNAAGVLSKSALTQYFVKLRDSTVVNVVLSLLARLHNILRDEPNLELYFHYAQLWPSSIPNSSVYNPDAIVEVLSETLAEVSQYYPHNVQWLKLFGDLNFIKGHYSTALKNYFEALVAASDYFIRPVTKTLVEDFTYRRMIKCCTMLQCYTQAALLCQFLDEIDYSTAFKYLSESVSSDATDCYYDCIWDVNILEFLISLHTKRNEHSKKQKAIEVVGLLELNSNNNEEIKREASNVRKAKFLRAISRQYIC